MKQCTLEPECGRGRTHCCSECDLEEAVYCICPSVEDGANGTCEFLKETPTMKEYIKDRDDALFSLDKEKSQITCN